MQSAVLRDVFGDIVMFPIWWYSRGSVLMLKSALRTMRGYARYLAIGIWINNIFVPMFGQRDWQSRLISIFMRSVQIVFRSFALLMIAFGVSLGAIAYLVLPITILLFGAYHVIGRLLYVA